MCAVVPLKLHSTLCNPMECSSPGFPVLHYLMECAKCPLSRGCHPTISSSVTPFSCSQSFPESGSFSMNWLFTPGSSNIGALACPSNEYSGLISIRIDWFDFFAVQGTLKSLLWHHNLKHQFFGTQSSSWSNTEFVHDYWKNQSSD